MGREDLLPGLAIVRWMAKRLLCWIVTVLVAGALQPGLPAESVPARHVVACSRSMSKPIVAPSPAAEPHRRIVEQSHGSPRGDHASGSSAPYALPGSAG